MSDPIILKLAKENYEADIARRKTMFPEVPGVRHYPDWEELVQMAVTIDGCFLCVRAWYDLAKIGR